MVNPLYNQSQFRSYCHDRFVRISLFFGALANISLWLWLIWQARNFTDLISLHYNIYFGIDLLGPWQQIFLLPLSGLIFLVINFFGGMLVYFREKILSYFLVGTSSFIQLLIILAAIFIVLINK